MSRFTIMTLALAPLLFSGCAGYAQARQEAAMQDERRLQAAAETADKETHTPSIVGYWASVQGGERGSWEFTDDGRIRIGGGPWMQYTLSGNNSVVISKNGEGASETYYRLTESNLSIYFDAEHKNLLSDFTKGR